MSLRGEIDDVRAPFHGGADRLGIGDVPPGKPVVVPVGDIRKIRGISRVGELVEVDDENAVASSLKDVPDEVGTDEPATAGDEQPHTIPISELSPMRNLWTRGRSAPGWMRTLVPIRESAIRPGIRSSLLPCSTIEFSISQRSTRQSGPIAV